MVSQEAPAGAAPSLPDGWRWEGRDGLLLLHAEALDALGAAHAFTTRVGGVSPPPFDTLNLGRGVGDAPEAVRHNRAQVLAALGRSLKDHVEASQVHGADAAVVDRRDRGTTVAGVDILATTDPSVMLAMHCADCVPILLVDPMHRAVAAVHAGWRGTAAGAAAAAVGAMTAACGSRAADLVAAVGPGIGACCYEVDRPVYESFTRWPWRDEVFAASRDGRWRLDLWEASRRQLVGAGMRSDAVASVRLCTSCHRDLFFSHRRDRLTGRVAALIASPAT
jgi:YfiH family protein